MNERTQERLRVEQAPSRCPWCHGSFESVRELVACAACGARHHAECHAQNKKCATCGSGEVLVHPSCVPQTTVPATAPPRQAGSSWNSPTLTPAELAIIFALAIPLLIVGVLIDNAFFPAGSPHAETGGKVLAAIVIAVPVVVIFARRWRRWRRSRVS